MLTHRRIIYLRLGTGRLYTLTASALFPSPGEQKRNRSQCGEHRGSEEPGPEDESTRVEIALQVSSHADQKEKERCVDQN